MTTESKPADCKVAAPDGVGRSLIDSSERAKLADANRDLIHKLIQTKCAADLCIELRPAESINWIRLAGAQVELESAAFSRSACGQRNGPATAEVRGRLCAK